RDRLREVLANEGVTAEDDALLLIARHADGGMRDALSVLDQCLSFGEGSLTAARVREVLGLVDDEVFGAILDLVADRRPAEVFTVVDRLSDAGADLVEAAAGLAELLRAILMVQYGAEPPVMAESSLQLVHAAASRHAGEDVVRMLKLLGEAETSLRRSANPRLVFETLLLRWALMDRAADLKALLEGRAPQPTGSAAPFTPTPSATIPPRQQSVAPPADPKAELRPAYAVPWSDEGLAAAWPDIVEAAGRQSRFLAQSLGQARPVLGEKGLIELGFGDNEAISREGVERQLGVVAEIASARLGVPVRLQLSMARGSGGPRGRLTTEEIRHERLQELRRRDPALDAAAEALDLELMDDA
ncbi:MAG TPA: hypothetical protein PLL69_12785, partial [Gemmatimonadales bacterium]|nr:hypothetical protein [Gemmatimonadales bacterium]